MSALSKPLILKVENWPDTDRCLWLRQFEVSGFFGEGGTLAHWAPPTQKVGLERYGQWLSYLARHHPQLLELGPAERITEDTVGAYVSECEDRGLSIVTIFGLVQVLASICEALDGTRDWKWLKTAAARLRTRVRALGLKPPIPLSAQEILKWSLDRMAVVEAMPRDPAICRALHFRDALMIGCLIACPVRARAFACMTIDKHLVLRNDRYEFSFLAEDMKDKKPRAFRVSSQLNQPLQRYLDDFRGILLRDGQSSKLWIGRFGRPLSKEGLANRLNDVTNECFGIPLRPHAFRHIAATSIAETDPEHVEIIRDVLGHSSLDMANQHYNRSAGVTSHRRLQSVIKELRRRSS